MNLVLVGYRGTGKSTVGKILAAELGLQYVCLDDEIVSRAGQSIPQIVEAHSWEYFRDLEEQVVKDVAGKTRQLLDTGGGVVTRPVNIKRLRENGIVFLLTAKIEDIVDRIGSDQGRPSLTGAKSFTDEVAEVLLERRPLYQQAADFTIDTSDLTPEEVVRQIARRYRSSLSPTR